VVLLERNGDARRRRRRRRRGVGFETAHVRRRFFFPCLWICVYLLEIYFPESRRRKKQRKPGGERGEIRKEHALHFKFIFYSSYISITRPSLTLSHSLSLSLLIMCFYLRFLRCADLSLRAQSFNLRLEVRLLLFVRQLRQLELLTGVSRLRSRLLRKTRVFANRVVDFLV